MNIYVSHLRKYDFKNELYFPIRNSSLNNKHNFILPHENSEDPFNTKELFESEGCDLVLAEVSFPATGQGIELGWADFLKIPVVCIYKDGTKPSGSLSVISKDVLMYTDTDDMILKIENALKLH